MSETHYLISDASKKVDVESHVLRYWEEELEMNIPRNEMGHRYYTDFHIRLFKQVKNLKEKGYQLKAIKTALAKTLDAEGESVAPTDVLEEDVMTALKECTEQEKRDLEKLDPGEAAELMNREKAEQFREFLTQMIGQAIEENNEKLSQDISRMVNDKVLKEIDYLMRVADESGSGSWMRRSVSTRRRIKGGRKPRRRKHRFCRRSSERESLGEMGISFDESKNENPFREDPDSGSESTEIKKPLFE